jgi:hypothetical protein
MKPDTRFVRWHAPGIWEDRAGAMHFDVPELLRVFDIEDTPAERERVTAMLREMLADQLPQAEVIVREAP